VEVTGPEGTYTGMIVNDSLVFANVPYGDYNGSAWMEGEEPVYEAETIGQSSHEMIFEFDLTGIIDGNKVGGTSLLIRPNPSADASFIEFNLPESGFVSVKVYSLQGALVRVLSDETRQSGRQSIPWDGRDDRGMEVSPGLYMIMLQAPGMNICTGAVRN
jgi:hypothetical protein